MSLSLHKLQRITEVTAEELYREIGSYGACILATGIILQVLHPYVDEVIPLPVDVKALNERWMQLAQSAVREPTEAEALEWKNAGAHSVAIGIGYGDDRTANFGREDGRPAYNGHLVAIVDRQYLVDPTIVQVDRPHKAIHVGPIVSEIPERGFIHGSVPLVLTLSDEEGQKPSTTLIYMAHPGDKTYRETNDWRLNRNNNRSERMIMRIRARIREDLGLS